MSRVRSGTKLSQFLRAFLSTFTVELALRMGGYYERLVAIVKRSLRKATDKMFLNNEQLLIILKTAEAVVNSRPLVFVGDDVNTHITLTPAHFLTLNPKVEIPDANQNDTDYINYEPEMSSVDRH